MNEHRNSQKLSHLLTLFLTLTLVFSVEGEAHRSY
jgi:hypothetical protein